MVHKRIAGLGEATVEAITAVYPTLPGMWAAYKAVIQQALASGRDGVAAARALLADLPLPNHTGRVGTQRSTAVYDLLFSNGANLAA